MDEYLVYQGTKEEICKDLAEDFEAEGETPPTQEECRKLLEFMQENKWLLDDGEIIQCSRPNRDTTGNAEFITEEMTYYIGIQRTTLFLLLFLLDKPLGGAVSFISKLLGADYPEKVVFPVDEPSGMKCILMELIRSRRKGADEHLLMKYGGQCCNNHFQCRRRIEERCCIKPEEVRETLHLLEKNKIVKKKRQRYYYQF